MPHRAQVRVTPWLTRTLRPVPTGRRPGLISWPSADHRHLSLLPPAPLLTPVYLRQSRFASFLRVRCQSPIEMSAVSPNQTGQLGLKRDAELCCRLWSLHSSRRVPSWPAEPAIPVPVGSVPRWNSVEGEPGSGSDLEAVAAHGDLGRADLAGRRGFEWARRCSLAASGRPHRKTCRQGLDREAESTLFRRIAPRQALSSCGCFGYSVTLTGGTVQACRAEACWAGSRRNAACYWRQPRTCGR